ncbi:MAG: FkbM family methyltransferase [Betaproteobacteria bacterium]|nr:FkbM family methyltransferase [Betaproteobacteria bacterium]
MKIDTQGFESAVLDGARQTLASISSLEVEMSFVELYEGQMLFEALHGRLRALGFAMINITPAFCDPLTGEILQADVIFRCTRPMFGREQSNC